MILLAEDQTATLDEVLAFIDTCSDSSSDHSSSSSEEIPHLKERSKSDARTTKNDDDSPAQQQQQQQQKQQQRHDAKPKAPRQRTRKRYKTEIEQLRELIVDLEARLANLERIRSHGPRPANAFSARSAEDSTTSSDERNTDAASTEFENAVDEYKRLQRSRRMNADLRDALVEQTHMHEELENLFTQQLTPEVSGKRIGIIVVCVNGIANHSVCVVFA